MGCLSVSSLEISMWNPDTVSFKRVSPLHSSTPLTSHLLERIIICRRPFSLEFLKSRQFIRYSTPYLGFLSVALVQPVTVKLIDPGPFLLLEHNNCMNSSISFSAFMRPSTFGRRLILGVPVFRLYFSRLLTLVSLSNEADGSKHPINTRCWSYNIYYDLLFPQSGQNCFLRPSARNNWSARSPI